MRHQVSKKPLTQNAQSLNLYIAEDEINEVKLSLDKNLSCTSALNKDETSFWESLANGVLRPAPNIIYQEVELRREFRLLKKNVLLALFLVNMVWMILLYSSSLPQLRQYNINTKLFATIFLSVYGGLLLVQFVNMICHRIITFCHYLSKLNNVDSYQTQRSSINSITAASR